MLIAQILLASSDLIEQDRWLRMVAHSKVVVKSNLTCSLRNEKGTGVKCTDRRHFDRGHAALHMLRHDVVCARGLCERAASTNFNNPAYIELLILWLLKCG